MKLNMSFMFEISDNNLMYIIYIIASNSHFMYRLKTSQFSKLDAPRI